MELFIIAVLSILLPCLFLFLFNKHLEKWAQTMSTELIGVYFNFIGVLFTLILAFVVVAAWEDYDNAMHTVENEAHKLMYIYEDAIELSDENKKLLQTKVVDYTQSIVNEEWNNMDNPIVLKNTKKKYHELMELKRTLTPLNDTDKDVLTSIDASLDDLKQLRHDREGFFESHVPNLLWFVLLGGSAVCFFFSCIISFEKLHLKMIMSSLITFSMTIVLYLTYCLSNPYQGTMKVSAEDYEKVLERISTYGKQ
jgi:hypothetical protein